MNSDTIFSSSPPKNVPTVPGEPRVFLNASVESDIEKHVYSELSHEVCGVLLGFPGKDDKGYFIHATHVIEGKFADQRGTSVTFTHKTWDYIYKTMTDRCGDAVIVGWYHSHPGFGVFYSSHDTFIQKNFFGQPWQIGIVMDPTTKNRGVFSNLLKTIQGGTCYWRLTDQEGSVAEKIECCYLDRIAAYDESDLTEHPDARSTDSDLILIKNQLVTLKASFQKLRIISILLFSMLVVAIGIILLLRFYGPVKESVVAPILSNQNSYIEKYPKAQSPQKSLPQLTPSHKKNIVGEKPTKKNIGNPKPHSQYSSDKIPLDKTPSSCNPATQPRKNKNHE